MNRLTQQKPELTISIPVTGSVKLILDCLDSITRHTVAPLDIIVVDNCADVHTIESIRERHPGVRIISNDRLMCYAHNQNKAIRLARTPWILVMNDDTEILDNSIDRMLEFIKARAPAQRVAAVAPKLVGPDRTIQQSTFCNPTLFTVTIWQTGLRKLIPHSSLTCRLAELLTGGRGTSTFWEHDRTMEVDNVNGAAVLMSRAAIEDVGPMDEMLPAYGEETEWHLRFRKLGYRIFFLHDAVVLHHGEITNDRRKNPDIIVKEAAGLLRIFEKHAPGWPYFYIRFLLAATSAAKLAFNSIFGLVAPCRWKYVRPQGLVVARAFKPHPLPERPPLDAPQAGGK